MVTTTTAAVKLALPSTPEQAACSANIDGGLRTFWKLVERLTPTNTLPLDFTPPKSLLMRK